MLSYNLPALQELLENIKNLTDVTAAFYDEDFRPVAASYNVNEFCRCIKKAYQGRCITTDESAFNELKRSSENYFSYTCHFGMTEIIAKFKSDNRVLGYLQLGPFRNVENQEKTLANIRNLCAITGDDETSMIKDYFSKPEFDDCKAVSVKFLVFAFFEYVKSKNILTNGKNIFFSEILPYIRNNLDKELTISHLCKTFYISKKQLYAIFEKSSKRSPINLINYERVQSAIHLLVNTDMPLADVAESVGIKDYTYFIKIFKRYTSHPPKYFRNKNVLTDDAIEITDQSV